MRAKGNKGRIPDDLKFGTLSTRKAVLGEIHLERNRHAQLEFTLRHSDLGFLRIMTEELGEIASAMDTRGKNRLEDIYEETIQLAAAAVALAERIRLQQDYI